jgi:hypothetical protein
MRSHTAARIALLVLSGFVAVSAIGGAIWVVPAMPLDWIKAGPFTDWTVPSLALGFVGVLAAAAFVALIVRTWAGALASILAGGAMVTFELVEIGVVGWTLSDPGPAYFQSWLQLVYLVVGSLLVLIGLRLWFASRNEAPPLWLIRPATKAIPPG